METQQFAQVSFKLQTQSSFLEMSNPARWILLYSLKFFYEKQYDLTFTLTYTEIHNELRYNHNQISKAIKELIKCQYWYLVKRGSKNTSAIYRHNHNLLSVHY